MKYVIYSFAVLSIIATFLPLWRVPYWWVRSFDFPRLQIAIFIAVTLGLLVSFAPEDEWVRTALIVGLALALIYQLLRVLPYTPLWRAQVRPSEESSPGERFRLLVTNVQMDNEEKSKWLEVIRANEADALFAVETDSAWIQAGSPLKEEYPYTIEIPQDNTYGMVLYSKWEIDHYDVKHMIDKDVPSLWVTLRSPGGRKVDLVGIHPRPPRPDTQQDSDQRDAELVLAAKEISRLPKNRPVVLCGDLNDVAWSASTRLFQRQSGLLDPRRGRGLFSTFHARHWFLRWPLDHIFHSDDFTLVDLHRLEKYGSDHFGISIHLQMSPDAEELHDAPEATQEDKEIAAEIVQETRENEAELSEAERRERNEEDV